MFFETPFVPSVNSVAVVIRTDASTTDTLLRRQCGIKSPRIWLTTASMLFASALNTLRMVETIYDRFPKLHI